MSLKSVMGRGLLAVGMAIIGLFTGGAHPALANHEQSVFHASDRGFMSGTIRWVSNKAFVYDLHVRSINGKDRVYAEWRQNRGGATTWKRLSPSTAENVDVSGRKEGLSGENPWMGVYFRICWDRGGPNPCASASGEYVNDFS